MELSACETEAIFEELTKVANLLPRKQQIKLACGIESCIKRGEHLVAEAPTGVGKTYAYLIPAILFALGTGKKVIISTAGKILQKQLVDEDLPKLQKLLPFEFSMSLGSDNYICDWRLSQGLQFGLFDAGVDIAALDRLAELRLSNPMATFLDCEFHVPVSLKKRICRESQTCTQKCQSKTRCAYILAAHKQQSANIVITNHHKILHQINNASKALSSVGVIVFDECHHLEDTATAVFSASLDSGNLIDMIKELYDGRSQSGLLLKLRIVREQRDAALKAAQSIIERVYDLHETINDAGSNLTASDVEGMRQLQSSLTSLANHIQRCKIDIMQSYASSLANYINTIDVISRREKEYIYWKEVTGRGWTVTATPTSISNLLRKKLFRPGGITTVHVSATVAVQNTMKFYRSRVGIIKAKEIVVGSPFDHGKQAAIYIPRNMPAPHETGYLTAAISEIVKLITHFQGKTLVLFTSYKALNEAYDILASTYQQFTFLRQQDGDTSTTALIDNFRKTDKAVLLASARFWEGLNIPGPALQCTVIMKLPFRVPTDPVALAHQEQLRKKGKLPFFAYQIPRALISFRQGCGRTIRTETDTGVIAILDVRTLVKNYGNRFIEALPACPIIRDISGFSVQEYKIQ